MSTYRSKKFRLLEIKRGENDPIGSCHILLVSFFKKVVNGSSKGEGEEIECRFISIDPLTGELVFRGIPGIDIFRNFREVIVFLGKTPGIEICVQPSSSISSGGASSSFEQKLLSQRQSHFVPCSTWIQQFSDANPSSLYSSFFEALVGGYRCETKLHLLFIEASEVLPTVMGQCRRIVKSKWVQLELHDACRWLVDLLESVPGQTNFDKLITPQDRFLAQQGMVPSGYRQPPSPTTAATTDRLVSGSQKSASSGRLISTGSSRKSTSPDTSGSSAISNSMSGTTASHLHSSSSSSFDPSHMKNSLSATAKYISQLSLDGNSASSLSYFYDEDEDKNNARRHRLIHEGTTMFNNNGSSSSSSFLWNESLQEYFKKSQLQYLCVDIMCGSISNFPPPICSVKEKEMKDRESSTRLPKATLLCRMSNSSLAHNFMEFEVVWAPAQQQKRRGEKKGEEIGNSCRGGESRSSEAKSTKSTFCPWDDDDDEGETSQLQHFVWYLARFPNHSPSSASSPMTGPPLGKGGAGNESSNITKLFSSSGSASCHRASIIMPSGGSMSGDNHHQEFLPQFKDMLASLKERCGRDVPLHFVYLEPCSYDISEEQAALAAAEMTAAMPKTAAAKRRASRAAAANSSSAASNVRTHAQAIHLIAMEIHLVYELSLNGQSLSDIHSSVVQHLGERMEAAEEEETKKKAMNNGDISDEGAGSSPKENNGRPSNMLLAKGSNLCASSSFFPHPHSTLQEECNLDHQRSSQQKNLKEKSELEEGLFKSSSSHRPRQNFSSPYSDPSCCVYYYDTPEGLTVASAISLNIVYSIYSEQLSCGSSTSFFNLSPSDATKEMKAKDETTSLSSVSLVASNENDEVKEKLIPKSKIHSDFPFSSSSSSSLFLHESVLESVLPCLLVTPLWPLITNYLTSVEILRQKNIYVKDFFRDFLEFCYSCEDEKKRKKTNSSHCQIPTTMCVALLQKYLRKKERESSGTNSSVKIVQQKRGSSNSAADAKEAKEEGELKQKALPILQTTSPKGDVVVNSPNAVVVVTAANSSSLLAIPQLLYHLRVNKEINAMQRRFLHYLSVENLTNPRKGFQVVFVEAMEMGRLAKTVRELSIPSVAAMYPGNLSCVSSVPRLVLPSVLQLRFAGVFPQTSLVTSVVFPLPTSPDQEGGITTMTIEFNYVTMPASFTLLVGDSLHLDQMTIVADAVPVPRLAGSVCPFLAVPLANEVFYQYPVAELAPFSEPSSMPTGRYFIMDLMLPVGAKGMVFSPPLLFGRPVDIAQPPLSTTLTVTPPALSGALSLPSSIGEQANTNSLHSHLDAHSSSMSPNFRKKLQAACEFKRLNHFLLNSEDAFPSSSSVTTTTQSVSSSSGIQFQQRKNNANSGPSFSNWAGDHEDDNDVVQQQARMVNLLLEGRLADHPICSSSWNGTPPRKTSTVGAVSVMSMDSIPKRIGGGDHSSSKVGNGGPSSFTPTSSPFKSPSRQTYASPSAAMNSQQHRQLQADRCRMYADEVSALLTRGYFSFDLVLQKEFTCRAANQSRISMKERNAILVGKHIPTWQMNPQSYVIPLDQKNFSGTSTGWSSKTRCAVPGCGSLLPRNKCTVCGSSICKAHTMECCVPEKGGMILSVVCTSRCQSEIEDQENFLSEVKMAFNPPRNGAAYRHAQELVDRTHARPSNSTLATLEETICSFPGREKVEEPEGLSSGEVGRKIRSMMMIMNLAATGLCTILDKSLGTDPFDMVLTDCAVWRGASMAPPLLGGTPNKALTGTTPTSPPSPHFDFVTILLPCWARMHCVKVVFGLSRPIYKSDQQPEEEEAELQRTDPVQFLLRDSVSLETSCNVLALPALPNTISVIPNNYSSYRSPAAKGGSTNISTEGSVLQWQPSKVEPIYGTLPPSKPFTGEKQESSMLLMAHEVMVSFHCAIPVQTAKESDEMKMGDSVNQMHPGDENVQESEMQEQPTASVVRLVFPPLQESGLCVMRVEIFGAPSTQCHFEHLPDPTTALDAPISLIMSQNTSFAASHTGSNKTPLTPGGSASHLFTVFGEIPQMTEIKPSSTLPSTTAAVIGATTAVSSCTSAAVDVLVSNPILHFEFSEKPSLCGLSVELFWHLDRATNTSLVMMIHRILVIACFKHKKAEPVCEITYPALRLGEPQVCVFHFPKVLDRVVGLQFHCKAVKTIPGEPPIGKRKGGSKPPTVQADYGHNFKVWSVGPKVLEDWRAYCGQAKHSS